MTVALGEFNIKSNHLCKDNITSLESSKIDTITNSYGLNQVIQEPFTYLTRSLLALT